MRRAIAAIAVLGLLAGAVAAYAELGVGDPAAKRAGHRPAVRIRGHVDGLYPGVKTVLHAKARNRSHRPLRLLRVKTRVGSPSAACDRVSLRAKRIRPRVVIGAHHRRRLRIPVRLRASAPDACQGAAFPLRYRARVKVARSHRR